MRNFLFVLFCMIAGFGPALQGQNLYLRAGTGFAIPVAFTGDTLGEFTNVVDSATFSTEILTGSLGGGIPLSVDVGFMFTDNIGLQVGGTFLLGTRVDRGGLQSADATISRSSTTRQFRIMPGIVITADSGKVQPYGRFGLSLPLSTTTTIKVDSSGGGVVTQQELRIASASNPGFQGAFGANFWLNDKFMLFAEAQLLAQRVRTGTGELTRWTRDGANQLDGLDVIDTQWIYVEEVNTESNGMNPATDNPDLPREVLSYTQNIGSLAIRVGLRIAL